LLLEQQDWNEQLSDLRQYSDIWVGPALITGGGIGPGVRLALKLPFWQYWQD